MAPRTSPLAVIAVLAAGVGVCALFAAVTVPSMLGAVAAWALAGGGVGLLVVGVVGLWVLQRRRDRSLW